MSNFPQGPSMFFLSLDPLAGIGMASSFEQKNVDEHHHERKRLARAGASPAPGPLERLLSAGLGQPGPASSSPAVSQGSRPKHPLFSDDQQPVTSGLLKTRLGE